MNIYILLDESDVVINTLEMPEEPVDQSLIDVLMQQWSATRAIRLSDNRDADAVVASVRPANNPQIGATWDGAGFLQPSPGPQFMLDYTGYNWTPVPPATDEPGVYQWDSVDEQWVQQ